MAEKGPGNFDVVSTLQCTIEDGFIKAESYRDLKMPILPKSLSLAEKKFLLAVERGDLTTVKRIIHRSKRGLEGHVIDLNCVDPLGRGALLMGIDSENLQMVELLVVMGLATRDALLHAIDKEFVEAVELLLEHEEILHKEGEPYSWEKVDRTTSSFTPDITPLVLAAHRNNYEILKILLDRGATIPRPHDVRCGCGECIRMSMEDSLRHSMSRINAYRALASPSLIALSSNDPILTAFELSDELKRLAYLETEFKQEYMDLRRQCQQFAYDLLGHTRSSAELAVLLNHDPTTENKGKNAKDNVMKLRRLELAIDYKQKKFVAHPNIQQLLASIWYEGLPGFRRKTPLAKLAEIVQIAVLFPIYCLLYIIAPTNFYAQLMKKPFMKFLIHASSYLFFLFLLILVSQRFDVLVIELFGTASMRRELQDQLTRQRGNRPTILELVVATYVIGYVYEEIREMWKEGVRCYFLNLWNIIDVLRDSAYLLVIGLRIFAYIQQQQEIRLNPAAAFIPREEWDDFDPQLISEGVCAMANIFSALKLVHLFSINPYLGPLQISLGRMVLDIIKFFFIYSLVLFAFACGLNQLLWYFSDLEKQKCFTLPSGLPDWKQNPESCMKWRRFANLFESSQSLFWASFGLMDLSNFELTGVKSYTRFWGMLIFGSYSVINVVVLLNLLIAMMSNSYALITEHSDTEWKFARSKLWMSYFDESGDTLPPPFNLLPNPRSWCGKIKRIVGSSEQNDKPKFKRSSTKGRFERDNYYIAVIRSLVWRYVTTMHRLQEMSEVTEDDINEIKGDISTLRFELLDVFKNNGMDISTANKNTKAALGRKMRIWERRLLRDFHVVSVTSENADEGDSEQMIEEGKNGNSYDEEENPGDKFRRLASVAVVINAAKNENIQTSSGRQIKSLSQIGKSMSNESFKSSQNLRKAMEEANRLAVMTPTPEPSPLQRRSSITLTTEPGTAVLELLRSMSFEEGDIKEEEAEQEKVEGDLESDVKSGNKAQAVNVKSNGHSNTEQQKGGFWAVNNKNANAVNSPGVQNKTETVDLQNSSNTKKLPINPINESNVAMDSKKEIQPPKAKETNKLDSLFPPEVKRTPKKLETEQKTPCPVTPQQTQQVVDTKSETDPNNASTLKKLQLIQKKDAPVEITGIDRTNVLSALPSAMIHKVKFEEKLNLEKACKDINVTSDNGIPLTHSNVAEKVEAIGSTASAIIIQEGVSFAGGKYNKAKNAPEAPPQTKLKTEENVNLNASGDAKIVVPNPDCPEDNTSDTMKKMKRQTSKGWL